MIKAHIFLGKIIVSKLKRPRLGLGLGLGKGYLIFEDHLPAVLALACSMTPVYSTEPTFPTV